MFEFNGKQYSLEQLQNIAEKKGYTFEELLQKNPTIKELKQGPVLIEDKSPVGGFFGEQAKTNAVAEPVATATAKQLLATDTALPSVNGSLDLPKPKKQSQIPQIKLPKISKDILGGEDVEEEKAAVNVREWFTKNGMQNDFTVEEPVNPLEESIRIKSN
jgi:hypothetical protein